MNRPDCPICGRPVERNGKYWRKWCRTCRTYNGVLGTGIRYGTNNGICKVCGRPAVVSFQSNGGKAYTRAVCGHCKSLMYKLGIRIEQLLEDGINGFTCERCGWNGYCDIHHRDGIHSNSKKDNLEILCPNCHRNHHSPLPEVIEGLARSIKIQNQGGRYAKEERESC